MQSESMLIFPMEGLEQEEQGAAFDSGCGSGEMRSRLAAGGQEVHGMQSHAVHKLWQSLSGKLKTLQGLALVIQLKYGHAYACRVRHAQPPAMPRLRHSFIWASAVAQQEHARELIIDPYFREQFAIGLADAEYQSFLAMEVPEVFVGSPKALQAMLEVACFMMRAALERRQVGTPPWRQPEAVMSMWFPAFYTDVLVKPQLDRFIAADPSAAKHQPLASELDGRTTGPVLPPRPSAVCVQPRVTKFCAQPQVIVRGFDLQASAAAVHELDRRPPVCSQAANSPTFAVPAPALLRSAADASTDALFWQCQRSSCQPTTRLLPAPAIAVQHMVRIV